MHFNSPRRPIVKGQREELKKEPLPLLQEHATRRIRSKMLRSNSSYSYATGSTAKPSTHVIVFDQCRSNWPCLYEVWKGTPLDFFGMQHRLLPLRPALRVLPNKQLAGALNMCSVGYSDAQWSGPCSTDRSLRNRGVGTRTQLSLRNQQRFIKLSPPARHSWPYTKSCTIVRKPRARLRKPPPRRLAGRYAAGGGRTVDWILCSGMLTRKCPLKVWESSRCFVV